MVALVQCHVGQRRCNSRATQTSTPWGVPPALDLLSGTLRRRPPAPAPPPLLAISHLCAVPKCNPHPACLGPLPPVPPCLPRPPSPAPRPRAQVRTVVNSARTKDRKVLMQDGFNYSTTRMINKYLEGKTSVLYPEGHDVFPVDLLGDTKHY